MPPATNLLLPRRALLLNYLDFLSQCISDFDALLCINNADASRISFPSGHASTAFNSAIFIALYVFHKVSFLKKSNVLRVTFTMLPVVFAVYVGMTRIRVYAFNNKRSG
jgi:membrane-associated phospholipid phosphatase